MSRDATLRFRRERAKREQGAALLVAVMLLSLLGVIGFASMDTVMRDRQVAGFQSRARTALYAAEAAVATAMGQLRQDKSSTNLLQSQGDLEDYDPAFPTPGAPQVINTGMPQDPFFHVDPGAAQAVRYVGRGGPCGGLIIQQNANGPQFAEALFDIRVRGATPEGARSTIQATTTLCHAYQQ